MSEIELDRTGSVLIGRSEDDAARQMIGPGNGHFETLLVVGDCSENDVTQSAIDFLDTGDAESLTVLNLDDPRAISEGKRDPVCARPQEQAAGAVHRTEKDCALRSA